MKALFLHAAHDLRYETVPDPTIIDDEDLIVRVDKCAICGSDLHYFHGTIPQSGFCIGHEAVGEVVEVGRGVKRRKPGDRVMMAAVVGCGQCRFCLAGAVNKCEAGFRSYGGHGLEGCQAEAVRVPQGDFNATLIPEGLTDDQALMLTDAQSTAYYGCLNADIGPGKTVAVVGLGPIGLMAVEAAYVLGASQVFAIDLLPERRARAEALGATVLLPGDAPAFIREATRGLMVDCAVELVGIDATVRLAIDLVGTGGTVSVVGANFNPEFKFPMDSAFFRSITFRIGACPVHSLWPQLVPLVREGRLHPERFISHRSALSDGVAAYQLFDKKADGVLKIVMEP